MPAPTIATTRRAILGLALAAPAVAHAQQPAFPSRPIRFIVPFPPGGAIDVIARLMAEQMGPALGQPLVIENRPGASGTIGADVVAKSAPDGHTFMLTINSTITSSAALYPNLPFDPMTSFTPIGMAVHASILLTAPNAAPFKDAPSFIAWAKALGRPVNYGSWGNGSAAHLFGEVLHQAHGVPMEHVPFRGEAAAITEMLAGRLDVSFATPVSVLPHIQAGAVKGLAMTGPSRSISMPDLPTFAEQGVTGLDLATFDAVWGPAGIPQPVVAKLNAAMNDALRVPAVEAKLKEIGHSPAPGRPEELGALVREVTPRWHALIRQAGVKVT
ncbi:MAG TPA: tripartite tricarboxylate transporter substrate binding protein [Roseomonas sp.]|jgi:tripartite-type tricarboxylate transporter receptor subunit TctC